jgi:hypothetical protein
MLAHERRDAMNAQLATSLVHGRWPRSIALLAALAWAAACSSLLDVKNPNNVTAGNLDDPVAAPSIANGALSTVARAWGAILTEYATATDELTWIGSRDGFRELDVGFLTNRTNEFVDAAFPLVGEARWTSDFAIKKLSGFDAASTLKNRDDLARSYLYAAIAYAMIGDMFNNFPTGSDQRTAAPPLGPGNMAQVYDTAVAYTTRGIAIAQATGNTTLRLALTAERARAEFGKAVWAKLHPPGLGVPLGGPFVSDASANTDAAAALALAAGTSDWKYRFIYSGSTIDNTIGAWVNSRQEMRVGNAYINRAVTPNDTLRDPITNAVDPEVRRALIEFKATPATQFYSPLTVVSSRELYLILAEAALVAGDTLTNAQQFAVNINAVRLLNYPDSAKYKYDPSNLAQPRPVAMLKYERKANLFLQGRRLHDLYRFGDKADMWQTIVPVADAVASPGTFFPITQIELLSNPYCVANPSSC